jgi:hypothetical protein
MARVCSMRQHVAGAPANQARAGRMPFGFGAREYVGLMWGKGPRRNGLLIADISPRDD